MKPLSMRVLRIFREMGKDQLDLHVLFEAAGNKPAERRRVLDAIEELTRAGMLEASGSDFYTLTEKGKGVIAKP
jgi:predicted transcriptional regulator